MKLWAQIWVSENIIFPLNFWLIHPHCPVPGKNGLVTTVFEEGGLQQQQSCGAGCSSCSSHSLKSGSDSVCSFTDVSHKPFQRTNYPFHSKNFFRCSFCSSLEKASQELQWTAECCVKRLWFLQLIIFSIGWTWRVWKCRKTWWCGVRKTSGCWRLYWILNVWEI